MALIIVLGMITLAFFALLAAKGVLSRMRVKGNTFTNLFPANIILSKKFCALCAAVSLTWIILLAMFWLGKFQDSVLIALLLGQSVVGIFYFLEKFLKGEESGLRRESQRESLLLFRLPFLLTLTALAYFAVSYPRLAESGKPLLGEWDGVVIASAFIFLLWAASAAVYLSRNSPRLKALAQKMVECCGKW